MIRKVTTDGVNVTFNGVEYEVWRIECNWSREVVGEGVIGVGKYGPVLQSCFDEYEIGQGTLLQNIKATITQIIPPYVIYSDGTVLEVANINRIYWRKAE